MRDYKALFIIHPDKEKSLEEVTAAIKETIIKANGKVEKEENFGSQKIAFPVKKNTHGVYYKLDFQIDPSQISTLNAGYKLNADILRAMITVK